MERKNERHDWKKKKGEENIRVVVKYLSKYIFDFGIVISGNSGWFRHGTSVQGGISTILGKIKAWSQSKQMEHTRALRVAIFERFRSSIESSGRSCWSIEKEDERFIHQICLFSYWIMVFVVVLWINIADLLSLVDRIQHRFLYTNKKDNAAKIIPLFYHLHFLHAKDWVVVEHFSPVEH